MGEWDSQARTIERLICAGLVLLVIVAGAIGWWLHG